MKFRLSFNFNQIEHSSLRLEGMVPALAFDISDDDLTSFGEVKYDIQVAQISGGAILSGQISARTTRRCSRCLSEFISDITVKDPSHFYKKETDKEFDLIPDLREDILILSPLNMLCSENCKGLCHVCGVDLNTSKCNCGKKNKECNIAKGVWNGLDSLKLTKNKKT